MDPVFNDRTQFPSFYRTIPNEEAEMDGIVQILKHFGWKWVGLIISDDATGYRARERISKELVSRGGCLAFSALITFPFDFPKEIKKTTVIVLFISRETNLVYLSSLYDLPPKLWITTSFIYNVIMLNDQEMEFTLNGSLSLLIQEGEIPGFKQFFYTFSPNNYPNNALIAYTWHLLFVCPFIDIPMSVTKETCPGNATFSEADVSVYGNHHYRVTYRVYTAVYALACALHNLYSAQPPANHWGKLESLKHKVKPWQINQFVRNVTFTTFPNDTHSFDKYGDPPARFNIIKLLFLPGDRSVITKVGNFNVSEHGIQFYINNSADLWGPHFNMTPELLCNAPCAPGYRKSKIEGAPSCCYDCIPCVDGEISNTSDSSTCFRCPGYEMSNKQRTACVPKMINYLSYEETLGASLASIALVLFLTTSAVQGVFVKYWETPIVRANNQNLSCLLLISLMLCFLCTLLFIGRPTQTCCLLRQVTFGIVFTTSVSTVLVKTLTVIIAFNATKPGSKLKKYVGTQLSIVLVTICSLGKIGICLIWMVFDPPFLEVDIFSERNTIILQCNEGSVTFFFCIIGYIGTLALLSFIAAFLAKDFPDRFNEAKNITFSMLGFCSVWGAFVPAYLSSKGSRMVAVEIFAILSSSAGLLGCIFAPKCYIIFLRPQLNTKVTAYKIH
uniref:G-protein coupled receptors family 3 profile domain-containing protein n=1 Tax=Xenopus tropicalis TaxID=8364 RepID=A0A1B8YAN9_XENTR